MTGLGKLRRRDYQLGQCQLWAESNIMHNGRRADFGCACKPKWATLRKQTPRAAPQYFLGRNPKLPQVDDRVFDSTTDLYDKNFRHKTETETGELIDDCVALNSDAVRGLRTSLRRQGKRVPPEFEARRRLAGAPWIADLDKR